VFGLTDPSGPTHILSGYGDLTPAGSVFLDLEETKVPESHPSSFHRRYCCGSAAPVTGLTPVSPPPRDMKPTGARLTRSIQIQIGN